MADIIALPSTDELSGMLLMKLGCVKNVIVSASRITPPSGRKSSAAPAARATRHHDAMCHVTPTSLRDGLRDFEQDTSREVPASVTALFWQEHWPEIMSWTSAHLTERNLRNPVYAPLVCRGPCMALEP
jgi:hypothetical protein